MSLTIKVYLMEDWSKEPMQIRRFNWTATPTFDQLIEKLIGIYPALTDPQQIIIKWKDEEGDWIDITTDFEVLDAINACEANLLRLWTSHKKQLETHHNKEEFGGEDACPWKNKGRGNRRGSRGGAWKMMHWGYACDGCNNSIYGSRFHCRVCSDFDLCQQCFDQNMHSQHSMVEMRFPKKCRRFGNRDQEGNTDESLKNVGEHIADMLSPMGINVDVEILPGGERDPPCQDEPKIPDVPPKENENDSLIFDNVTSKEFDSDSFMPDPPPQRCPEFFHPQPPKFTPNFNYYSHFGHTFPPVIHPPPIIHPPHPIYPHIVPPHFHIPDDLSPKVKVALDRLCEMGFDISKPKLIDAAKKNDGDLEKIINIMLATPK